MLKCDPVWRGVVGGHSTLMNELQSGCQWSFVLCHHYPRHVTGGELWERLSRHTAIHHVPDEGEEFFDCTKSGPQGQTEMIHLAVITGVAAGGRE